MITAIFTSATLDRQVPKGLLLKQVQKGGKLSTVYACVSSNIRAQMKQF